MDRLNNLKTITHPVVSVLLLRVLSCSLCKELLNDSGAE